MSSTTRKIGKHLVTVKLSSTLPKGFIDHQPRASGNSKILQKLLGSADKTGRPFIAIDPPVYSKLKEPRRGFGIYLPAVFEVEGLPCKITFTLNQIEIGKPRFGITEAQLDCPNGVSEFSIPWQRLLSMAINSASWLGEHLPPNYRVEFSSGYQKTDSKGSFIPYAHASLPNDVRKEIVGFKQKFDGSKDDYKKIGELWRSAPHGKKHREIATQFGFSEKWAHKHTAIGARKYPQYFKGYKQKKGRKTK